MIRQRSCWMWRAEAIIISWRLMARSERMTEQTRLIIRKAPHSIKIVKQRNQRYFSTLREKLMWGADQRQR